VAEGIYQGEPGAKVEREGVTGMARIRSIKPEFFVSEQVAELSPTCRLLFVGMWLFCDDAGIHPASSRQLKMEVFPGDNIAIEEIACMVSDMLRVGLLIEYEVPLGSEVKKYWQVTGWHHQKIDRPRFIHPQPDSPNARRIIDEDSPTPRAPRVRAGSETIGDDRKGDDRKGEREMRACARFVPPSVDEVQCYASEAGLQIDPHRFVDFYASKDWKVGRVKMKDWRAAARNANRDGWCSANGSSRRDVVGDLLYKDHINVDTQ
jgi:hypothetical protein